MSNARMDRGPRRSAPVFADATAQRLRNTSVTISHITGYADRSVAISNIAGYCDKILYACSPQDNRPFEAEHELDRIHQYWMRQILAITT